MLTQPILRTSRLVLRPFTLADAPEVQRLAGSREVAATTAAIPHPYEDGMAQEWIAAHTEGLELETNVVYAITAGPADSATSGALFGAIGLMVAMEHRRAELGYWIGRPYWGRGYCTEAAGEMLRYGFEELGLHRILARHFGLNPASGRVMQKIGMTREGQMRQHFFKWDHYEDIEFYGVLSEEWLSLAGRRREGAP